VVEEPNFTLTFLTEDAKRKQIAEDYWAGRRKGYSWIWTETVSTIAARYGMPKHLLPAAVREIAKAFDTRVKCSECSAAYELTSRSALTTKHWGSFVCARCQEERVRAEQQKRREEGAQLAAWQRATIAELSSRAGARDYDSISYAEAVVLYAIALASDETYESGILGNAGQLHLCPSDGLTRQLLGHLFRKGLLQFSPDTPTSAVEPGEGGVFSYYPFEVRWRVSPAANGATFPQVFERLGRIIDLRQKHAGYEHSVLDLWRDLAFDDAVTFLRLEIVQYRCFSEYRRGPKTDEAVQHALKNFAIPQVRRIIKSVVKEAAAYSTHRGYDSRHAQNTIPGGIIRYVDRALSDHWKVHPLVYDWQKEEALLWTVLYDRVLAVGSHGFNTLSENMLQALLSSQAADQTSSSSGNNTIQ